MPAEPGRGKPYQAGNPPFIPPGAADGYPHHPLHHVYRRRIRGIRVRWLSSGFILGLAAGVLITLIASALVVTQFPSVVQSVTGEPDVAVVIGEAYLNREATARLQSGYTLGSPNLALKSVKIDLQSGNRMDLQPVFTADLILGKVDINAVVKNELTVENGKLVIGMIGDPQLGNLNLPLDLLPFDLKGSVKQAIDKVNNELLISEINQALASGFGDSSFDVQGVTTTDSNMSIRLQHY